VSSQRMLLGRAGEQAVVGRLLADARAGRSGALVLRGEAGIGKTALLEDAAVRAAGMRVLRTAGVPGEAELPFSALHLLLRAVTDRIPRLPAPQAAALGGAFGLTPVQGIDQFSAGAAVLTLLADLAEERPLLVLVDDAHWLDQASARTLTFAARRLDAEGIAMLFAARAGEGDRLGVLTGYGLPVLELTGLDDAAARALLADHAGELASVARARIIAEAGGNPLALLELPKGLTAAQRQGSLAPLPVAVTATPAPSRVQAAFADRLKQLPAPTQTLLLVAAAADSGELAVVRQAAQHLGSSLEDAEAAERAGLVTLAGTRVSFRHPLARAAAYQNASIAERMATHRALAAALEGEADADRRAWHLAAAATGPDETVAAALEEAARRARDRGGIGTAAAAYERAAQLSSDPGARAARLTDAAAAALVAGQLDRAETLAALAGRVADDPDARARAASVRADVAFQQRSPQAAARILIEGAVPLGERDPMTALRMLGIAASVAWFGGDRATADRAVAALDALPHDRSDGAVRTVAAVHGMRRLFAGDFAGGLPRLRELVAGVGEPAGGLPTEQLVAPHYLARLTGDDQAILALASAQVAACRARGMLGSLPIALLFLADAQLLAGLHEDARANATEGLRLSQDTLQYPGRSHRGGILAKLAAIEGDRQRCEELAGDVYAEAAARGLTPTLAVTAAALILLDLGLGRYEAALDRLATIPQGSTGETTLLAYGLPDLIEAAVRAGQPDQAQTLLDRFQGWADHAGQSWAVAVAHRCQALVHPGQDAEEQYTAALTLHADGRRPFEHARTRLAYGRWLRRHRRRTHARTQLRAACAIFDRLGAVPWAKQARTELRAAGEAARPAARPDPLACLTPQELQVVRLAATGASNRDIAAQLFLSPRTVGYHLYKAFPKLGITSRHELYRLDLAQPGKQAGADRS
jgi:DNA-binding CsgD family transcriptional regulator